VSGLRVLERFARTAPRALPAGEACGLCAAPVFDGHRHLVECERRQILCVCQACQLLFQDPAAAGGHYRLVPERVLIDERFTIDEEQWAALKVPVRLAFFFFNSALVRWVALFPSPAGAIEADLSTEPWQGLIDGRPLAARVVPDVEALLVFGRPGRPFQTLLVPIDACYRLVALVRQHWRGFSGGDQAWREIEAFFVHLHSRAHRLKAAP
jgi:hypothetical protein